ncbi:MAG: hypothetical protein PUB42_06015 [Firmicutes bacterium]|nr:hypothetical protein [Bacillota bacterium]
MGLFFNYNKPGPGIDKNAPKKKGIFLYFELLWRKLGKLIQVNMLYFLVSIPVMFIYYLFFLNIAQGLVSGAPAEHQANMMVQLTSFLTILLVCLWGTGPISCGFTFILRNFAREEHVWLASDFFEKIKQNWKQGLCVLILDFVMLFFGSNAMYFYIRYYGQTHNMLALYGFAVLAIMMVIYTFMHFYIYQFIVTFENKIGTLIKNSMLMALANLPMNVLLCAVVTIISFFLFNVMTPLGAMIVSFVCWISFMRFPLDFYAARIIKRKLIGEQERHNEETEESEI